VKKRQKPSFRKLFTRNSNWRPKENAEVKIQKIEKGLKHWTKPREPKPQTKVHPREVKALRRTWILPINHLWPLILTKTHSAEAWLGTGWEGVGQRTSGEEFADVVGLFDDVGRVIKSRYRHPNVRKRPQQTWTPGKKSPQGTRPTSIQKQRSP